MKNIAIDGKKIKNIDKNTCTAEQVIAYNFAFSCSDLVKNAFSKCLEMDKRKILLDIFNLYIKQIDTKKYNIDIIYLAFMQNIEKYVEKPFIALNYAQIGEFFQAIH